MSNRIPKETIQDIVSRADIIEVIQSRISIVKKGQNYSCRCPFHDEKTPSFSVNADKQFYYCFGCGAHGNVISFLIEYDRMEFMDALTYLAEQVGVTLNAEPPTEADQQRDDL